MSEAAPLEVADEGAVRLLTMNRPEKLNALNAALRQGLVAAVEAAHADDSVAVIILTGAGRAFSAGADMAEAAARADDDAAAARRHAEASHAHWLLGALTDKPLIAAVRGYALGGGCNLAIGCDLAVAGESAVFGYPEVRRGLAATMVTPPLLHLIGRKAAFELLTLAENVPAARALALGLINRVVPDERVLEEAQAMARGLAGFDLQALRATKRLFQTAAGLGLEAGMAAAREAMLLMRESGRGR